MLSKIKGLLLAFLPFLIIGFYPALLKAESPKAKSASWDTKASVVLVGDRDDHRRNDRGRWDHGNQGRWDRDRDWRHDWDDNRWKHRDHDRGYYYGRRYAPSYNYYYSYPYNSYPYSYGYSPYGYYPGYNSYPYYGGNSGFTFGGLLRLW